MDFIVEGDEKELPQNSLLSIRVGKHQRTCALREGLVITLPAPGAGETCEVKLLNEAGSKEVSPGVSEINLETLSGKVNITARMSEDGVPANDVERTARVRSQEEAARKKYMEEKQLNTLFQSLLRSCLSAMPDHPESYLADLLKRRHPTLVKEVIIAEKIEAMEKELASFKEEGKMVFSEKATVEQDLARRINQLKKLDGEKKATQSKLDTTKVKLSEEEKRAKELKAERESDRAAAAQELRELSYTKEQELAGVRAELEELQNKEEAVAEQAAAEDDKTAEFEDQIKTLNILLEEVTGKLAQEADARKAAEASRAVLDAELKKLSKLRLAAEHFFTDASDVIEIPSPR